MTALDGFTTSSVIGQALNARLSPGLSGFGVDYWPRHAAMLGASAVGTIDRALPVSVATRALAGFAPSSYVLDYYNRIHVTPLNIALGNLLGSQTRTLEVWNAWRDKTQTLASVTQIKAGGIDLTAPGALPLSFAPLQARQWQLQVSTDGSPTIDATLGWLFTDLQPIDVHITGQRLTAWGLTPDWSKNGITETLGWLTDMQPAIAGSVLRVVDRDTPRRQWEFDVISEGAERQRMESGLAAWRGRNWALPVWPDQTVLSAPLPAGTSAVDVATAGLDFSVGGLAMLHLSAAHNEIVELTAVNSASIELARPTVSAWPIGTRLWPVRLTRITDTPKYQRLSSGALRSTLRFESTAPNDWPAVAPAITYKGIPVLEDRPDEAGGVTVTPDRQLDVMDNDVGAVNVTDTTDLPWTTQTYAWWLAGRGVRADQRSVLYWLAGRANALWLPSFNDDITLVQTAPYGTLTLQVANAGFALFAVGLPGHRHIRIEHTDGTVDYRGVTGAAVVDIDTEQLSIDSALGSVLDPAQVRQISWMMLAGLSRDDVEIEHLTDSEGLATCAVTFTALPQEEPSA